MKVYLDSIGCRLNQSEIEGYARQFLAAGHQLVGTMEEADLMVLNTCAVTAAASSDSRQKIRQAHRLGVKEVVVTGCMSTLKPHKTAELPGVVRVVPNAHKDNLVADLLGIPVHEFDLEPVAREPIPGSRLKTRAFIKVQDGCDNKCTFCITTVARGAGRSRTVAQVLADIRAAQHGGAQEVVLTGVHLGSWGHDFSQPQHLGDLIQEVLAHSDVPRLRISSLEPWDISEDFFDLWQDQRLCRHLHLPLQSGSAGVLRRMARKTTPDSFAALVDAARSRIPGVAITTDMIVGFPGESDQEFEETRRYMAEMHFAGAHVFTYSARPGTAAAGMPGQVHNFTRKQRNAVLREIAARSEAAFNASFIGQQSEVLWESIQSAEDGEWLVSGLTDNYLRVNTLSKEPLHNQITPVRLTQAQGTALLGELI